MELRIPKAQALLTLALCLLGVAIFVSLMGRFGGPELQLGGDAYTLTATLEDSEGLSKKSDVLVRGVKVGEVTAIESDSATAAGGADEAARAGSARMTIEVYPDYADIVRRGASVRVGEKTLLGEAYVDLTPGSGSAPPLRSGATVRAVNSTELDEALQPLARQGGDAMASLVRTFGVGARSPRTAERTGLTAAELRALVGELRGITETLKGQEANIAAGVRDTHTVLRELGSREAQVQALVAGGRATLGAIASQRSALETGLAELPALLTSGRETLSRIRPLLDEAGPLLADLRAASPELTPALRDLRPVARDARSLLDDLPEFNRTALPFLRDATPVVEAARPAARALGPVLRNLVPALDYLLARKRTLISWFSNTYGIRSDNPDGVGEWARFLLFIEDKSAFGLECQPPDCTESGFNPYAPADDQPRLAPYARGSYPRLTPFQPPDR